jgi:hypothetical protein
LEPAKQRFVANSRAFSEFLSGNEAAAQ